jgi:hypothetical protein
MIRPYWKGWSLSLSSMHPIDLVEAMGHYESIKATLLLGIPTDLDRIVPL